MTKENYRVTIPTLSIKAVDFTRYKIEIHKIIESFFNNIAVFYDNERMEWFFYTGLDFKSLYNSIKGLYRAKIEIAEDFSFYIKDLKNEINYIVKREKTLQDMANDENKLIQHYKEVKSEVDILNNSNDYILTLTYNPEKEIVTELIGESNLENFLIKFHRKFKNREIVKINELDNKESRISLAVHFLVDKEFRL